MLHEYIIHDLEVCFFVQEKLDESVKLHCLEPKSIPSVVWHPAVRLVRIDYQNEAKLVTSWIDSKLKQVHNLHSLYGRERERERELDADKPDNVEHERLSLTSENVMGKMDQSTVDYAASPGTLSSLCAHTHTHTGTYTNVHSFSAVVEYNVIYCQSDTVYNRTRTNWWDNRATDQFYPELVKWFVVWYKLLLTFMYSYFILLKNYWILSTCINVCLRF